MTCHFHQWLVLASDSQRKGSDVPQVRWPWMKNGYSQCFCFLQYFDILGWMRGKECGLKILFATDLKCSRLEQLEYESWGRTRWARFTWKIAIKWRFDVFHQLLQQWQLQQSYLRFTPRADYAFTINAFIVFLVLYSTDNECQFMLVNWPWPIITSSKFKLTRTWVWLQSAIIWFTDWG